MDLAIIGSILGVLGGLVGTFFSIRNTHGPRERRFIVCAALVIWGVLGLAALAVFLWPPLRSWAWVPICVLALFGAPLLNQRQAMIRREEARK